MIYKRGSVDWTKFPHQGKMIYKKSTGQITRLGESGCDNWTLARITGHSNIRISQRYVYPSAAHIERSVNGREVNGTGDKTGDIGPEPKIARENELPTIAEASMG